MAATAIGLDVGTNAVRAVEIELSDPPVIQRMGQVGLPVGAVVDGEVGDVDAVSTALRTLWTQAGFRSRRVRVGMSSARVIVRAIDMPRMSHEEMMSTVRLQIDDYVPLPPDETVFAVRPFAGPDQGGQTTPILLAATHQDAVQPLLMAVRGADLQVAAVDVIPAALALALTEPDTATDNAVDLILSVGAGTVVVVAARGGEPLFARTLTNACGRRTTERIASRLGIGQMEAERYKRLGATEDALAAVAYQANLESAQELTDELRDSIDFYLSQPSSRPVRRLILTGGGSQLPGLASRLTTELGLEVDLADPFWGLVMGDTGFAPDDLPRLAPYMAAAVGVALGATRPKELRIDLRPIAAHSRRLGARRLLVGVGGAVLIAAAGMTYMDNRTAIANESDRLSDARAQLADLRAQLEARSPATSDVERGALAKPDEVVASVAPTNIDWMAVDDAIQAHGGPLDVAADSMDGSVRDTLRESATAAPTAPATVSYKVTASTYTVAADWLDAVASDGRFSEPWATGFALVDRDDGSKAVQFTVEMSVTDQNLVDGNAQQQVTP